jgi:hypothetical protein
VESLAFLVVCLVVVTNLCGPGALLAAYYGYDVLAAVIGGLAIMLGWQWYSTVYTWARYLGLLSLAMGAGAIWLVFKHWTA